MLLLYLVFEGINSSRDRQVSELDPVQSGSSVSPIHLQSLVTVCQVIEFRIMHE